MTKFLVTMAMSVSWDYFFIKQMLGGKTMDALESYVIGRSFWVIVFGIRMVFWRVWESIIRCHYKFYDEIWSSGTLSLKGIGFQVYRASVLEFIVAGIRVNYLVMSFRMKSKFLPIKSSLRVSSYHQTWNSIKLCVRETGHSRRFDLNHSIWHDVI